MKANTVVEFAVIHYGWMNGIVLIAADALNGKVGEGMDKEKVIAGLIMLADRKNDNSCEGLKCCKIAEDALALLKEQEEKYNKLAEWSEGHIVFCKDCKYLIDHYGFMDDGYCRNMRNKYNIKFKPDKNWFCADGKPKEGREA